MLEVIFVIVVIGILAAVFIPRVASNKLAEDVNKFISHVRYAQHLGMMYDAYNAQDANWYDHSYCMQFTPASSSTFSGYELNKIDMTSTTYAKDTLDKSKDLKETLHVSFTISSAKQFNRLCFDHLGRPFANSLHVSNSNMIYNQIVLHFTNGSDSQDVAIEPETGYIHLK